MNRYLKRTFLLSAIATSLVGVNLLSIIAVFNWMRYTICRTHNCAPPTNVLHSNENRYKPASASDRLLRDIGIGAAADAASGAIFGSGSGIGNAANGAAVGAAVHATHKTFGSHRKHRDLARDAGVGAATGVLAGTITNHHHPLNNAINGAAAGATINLLEH
jgi:hypothetical protein